MNVSIPTLSQSAMLMYVSISVWSARKLDKKESAKTVRGAKATADAARVNKHLLAAADDKLKAVQRKANEIRAYVETNSLPWDDAGNRLVSNDQALIVVGDVHRLQQEFYAVVDDFVMEYPVLRAQAIQNLGEMGDNSDYPQPDVVRSKFATRLSFNPLPTGFGDIRQGMSEMQAQKWQEHFEANVKVQMNDALKAAWSRLREDLEKYSDRLRLKDGTDRTEIFRDTMVTNLQQTVEMLRRLNVFKDPELERTTMLVQQEVAKYSPEQLRNSVATAITVKSEVDRILDHMNSFL